MKQMIQDFIKKNLPQATKRQLRKLLWKSNHLHHTLRSGLQVQISSNSDWYIYNEIFVDRDYDPAIDMALQCSAGQMLNIVDLGANVGLFTMRVVDKVRTGNPGREFHITAVEGNPITASRLKHSVTINGLGQNVKVVHGLVGNKTGSALISDLEFSGNNSIATASDQGTMVDYVNLSNTISEKMAIDLLKCDIEGSELSFVESYPDILSRTRVAIVELHPMLCDSNRCKSLLKECGFDRSRQIMEKDAVVLMQFWRS